MLGTKHDVKYWFLVSVILACGARSAFCWPAVFPTGTTLYDPEKAYNGYVLYSPMGNGSETFHLINMRGQFVHEWKLPFRTISGRLLPSGNLLVLGIDREEVSGRPGLPPFNMGGYGGIVAEFNWNGELVFRHRDLNSHHEVIKLANGNYLYLAWEPVPQELREKVRGGIKETEFKAMVKDVGEVQVMFNDVLVEIDPQGQIVWVWRANEHLDPDIDILSPVHTRVEWSHANAIQELADGNILVTARKLDSVFIVNRKTNKIIYRWGNLTHLDKQTGELVDSPAAHSPATKMNTLSGPHDGREIPAGVPGAGHLTCYDNGLMQRTKLHSSRAVEFDRATGDLVWQSMPFKDERSLDFGRKHFSDSVGSVQKLPNGNFLICEGTNGQFFQITPDLKEVWEYVNPFGSDEQFRGAVFKVQMYAPDYCPQFKDLPPAAGAAIVPASSISESSDASSDGRGEIGLRWVQVVPIALGAAALTFVAGLILGKRIRAPRSPAPLAAAETARAAHKKKQKR